MCNPAPNKAASALPPPPALGSGMVQQSRLTIQGRQKQLNDQIAAAGG